jgi:hypothetical protein
MFAGTTLFSTHYDTCLCALVKLNLVDQVWVKVVVLLLHYVSASEEHFLTGLKVNN